MKYLRRGGRACSVIEGGCQKPVNGGDALAIRGEIDGADRQKGQTVI